MPVVKRAHRGRQLRCCLAAWFVALLAVAPFARPTLPVDLAALPAASVESVAAHDDGMVEAKQPGAALRPAQPSTLGILSRLSLLETALGPPPLKASLFRPSAAGGPLLAPRATTAFGSEIGQVFQRSSVGTARTPTGPPS